MYSAVIFDLDGVMLDTEPISRAGWQLAVSKFGLELSDEVFLKMVGLGIGDIGNVFKEAFGDEFDYEQARKMRLEYMKEHIDKNGIGIKPGVFEVLDFLDEQKVPRAIATSTTRKFAERKLALTKLGDRFDTIVYGDQIENGKPSPDIFLAAAKQLNVPAEKCLVIEDSENGIKAAHAAGMTVVMIPDLKQPTEQLRQMVVDVFASLHEVIEFLRGRINNE